LNIHFTWKSSHGDLDSSWALEVGPRVQVRQPVSESMLQLRVLTPRLNHKIVGAYFGCGNADKGAMGSIISVSNLYSFYRHSISLISSSDPRTGNSLVISVSVSVTHQSRSYKFSPVRHHDIPRQPKKNPPLLYSGSRKHPK
jgi:hypothetical protein